MKIMRTWGFVWGGAWLIPDGMHFRMDAVPQVTSGSESGLTATPRP